MPGSRLICYWDTCVFIAWLKAENEVPGKLNGIQEYLARFRRRDCSLMTSVLTLTEMCEAELPAGTSSLLDEAMQRPNFSRISVDVRVARLARELRDHYLLRPAEYDGMTITVPDAIHLATAIIYRADVFHTYDSRNREKYKSLGLLPLSGKVGGYSLSIARPEAGPQLGLGFGGASS